MFPRRNRPEYALTSIDEAGGVALAFTSAAYDLARIDTARAAVVAGLGTEGDASGYGGGNVVHVAEPAPFTPAHSAALFVSVLFK